MKKLLFVCSQNRLRSPTAEQVFNGMGDIQAVSGRQAGRVLPVQVDDASAYLYESEAVSSACVLQFNKRTVTAIFDSHGTQ